MDVVFCKLDNALMQLIVINGVLKKKCKCCGDVINVEPDDSLLYVKHMHSIQKHIFSQKLLKNIANDDISVCVDKPCSNCKKPFTKIFISNDLTTSFIVCKCQFQ